MSPLTSFFLPVTHNSNKCCARNIKENGFSEEENSNTSMSPPKICLSTVTTFRGI